MGFGEFNGPVYLLFNIDAKVILNFPFICQLIAFFELVEVFYEAILLSNYDAIIYISYKDDIFFCVDTIIYFGLCE